VLFYAAAPLEGRNGKVCISIWNDGVEGVSARLDGKDNSNTLTLLYVYDKSY
jgi:hypothetical protein